MNICSFHSHHDEAEFVKGNFPSLGTQGVTVGMNSIGEQGAGTESWDRNSRWWNFYLLSMKWCLGTEPGHPMTKRSVSFVLDVRASRKWLDNPPRVDLLSILSVKHASRPRPETNPDQFLRLSTLNDCGSGSLVVHQDWEIEEMKSLKCQSNWTAQSSQLRLSSDASSDKTPTWW